MTGEVSGEMLQWLRGGPRKGTVHSVFTKAVNVAVPGGLVSVLSRQALLEPMSVPIYDMMVLPQVPAMDAGRIDFIRVYGQTTEDGSFATYTILTAQRPQAAEGETLTADDVTWRSNGANVTDDPTVRALLGNLTTLTIDKCLDYNPSADAVTHCGFDAPAAILEVDFRSEGGAEQTLKLTIGNELPDGSGRYVRYGDEDPTLYRLADATLEALLSIAAEGLEG